MEKQWQLNDNEVHLWLTDLNSVDPGSIPAYRQLMNDSELERNQRFRFESGRFADCVTRALARTVLSRYTDVDPGEWQFDKGEHGKPHIAFPLLKQPLCFNLSHTKRYVVCAVGLKHDLGVDVECIERKNNVLNIADHYFSSREVEDLFSLQEEHQIDRFFDYWTLKEAYMKASGEGISLGLGNFSFQFLKDGAIRIQFSPQINDNPNDWCFWLFSPARDHRLAVAVRAGKAAAMKLKLFETVPLSELVVEKRIATAKL